jgi:hypothetical protein
VRGLAEGAAELAAEVSTREAGRTREVVHVQRLEVPRIGEILGAKQVTSGRDKGHGASIATAAHIAMRRMFAMCRNIHTLFNFEPPATQDEVRAAALQYVRKISGFTNPSRANEAAFERAVDEVAAASSRLLDELVTSAGPKDRAVEAERARARAAKRYAAA